MTFFSENNKDAVDIPGGFELAAWISGYWICFAPEHNDHWD